MNIPLYISFYLFSMFFVWLSCRDLAKALLKIGKSRNGYKKLLKSKTIIDKIFLKNYINSCAADNKKMQLAVWINNIYIVYTPIFAIILLISLKMTFFKLIIFMLFLFKSIIVDIPFIIFFFLNTCHAPNGGVEWKFERDYRKSRKKK